MEKKMFKELMSSIKEAGRIKRGRAKPSRVFKYEQVDVKRLREQVSASQAEFGLMIGVSERTVQNWEQGRRKPRGPARALLKVFSENPKVVAKALTG